MRTTRRLRRLEPAPTRMEMTAGSSRPEIWIAVALTCATLSVPASAEDRTSSASRVERGRYLTTIAACHDCHSPKSDAQGTPDPARLLSGRPLATRPPMQGRGEIRVSLDLTAWAGPWGNSYSANLTPDPDTGIGARYTEAAFVKTIRTGKKPEGEDLSPPMPWTVYRNMTDEDLKSIYAYLRTLKPIRNNVRESPTAWAGKR
jgi:mono/diheme cytochrome c family protein